jgi:hypothetical protein
MSASAGSWGTPQHNAGAPTPPNTPNTKPKVSLSALAGGAYLKATEVPRPEWFRVRDWTMKHFESNQYGAARDALVLTLERANGDEVDMTQNGINVAAIAEKSGLDDPADLVGWYILVASQKVTTKDGLRDGLRVIDCATEVPH